MTKRALLLKNKSEDTIATLTVCLAGHSDEVFKKIIVNSKGETEVVAASLMLPDQITYITKLGVLYRAFANISVPFTASFRSICSVGTSSLANMCSDSTGLIGEVSFPELTDADQMGTMYSAFEGCTGITSISFPKLSSCSYAGLNYAFGDCTGITGVVQFPKLTSIHYSALNQIFANCMDITEVHFTTSLKGDYQCTASTLGCTNSTIYFDL